MVASPDATAIPPIELPTRPPEQCRVLVVDDDEGVVRYLETVLAMDGYQVLTSGDGLSALEVIRTQQPDVVVLDVLLPGMDGIAVCQHIKTAPETHFLPVILVTGHRMRSHRLAGLRAGADDFLDKPIDHLELTVRVRSLLRTRQLYEEIEAHNRELEARVDERTHELREAYRRLEELSQVKSNVLNMISHELRTPLLHVKMAISGLRQEWLSEANRAEAFQTIEQAFAILGHSLDTVEAFSDPTALKLAPDSVVSMLQGAIERIRHIRGDSIERILVDVPANLPPVLVDAKQMTRILAHLIDNGLKFSEGRPVLVRAALVDSGVYIMVQDEGVGIPPEKLDMLFQPFQQGDISSTRAQGGIGMGLALIKMVLDAHGIALELDSSPGEGTTVSFIIPLADL